MILPRLRFTEADADAAADEWRFNCGPASLCAVLGMTPAEVRGHLLDFERKGYTNPTLLFDVLRGLGVRHSRRMDLTWPDFGLVRVQWHGPWMAPNVPMAARYRHTHWVASCIRGDTRPDGVFDVNCIGNGSGWVSFEDWSTILVPELLRLCEPKADGEWSVTHSIEVQALVAANLPRERR